MRTRLAPAARWNMRPSSSTNVSISSPFIGPTNAMTVNLTFYHFYTPLSYNLSVLFCFKLDAGVPLFNMYSAFNCAGEPEQSFSFPSQCYPEADDAVYDDTYVDTYLPPIINPPPSVSTTPFPTNHGHARSTAVFCTINEPTLMPASVPTVFPTKAVKQAAVFDVTQVYVAYFLSMLLFWMIRWHSVEHAQQHSWKLRFCFPSIVCFLMKCNLLFYMYL